MYSVYTALQYLYRPSSCTWDYKYILVQRLHCSTILVVQTPYPEHKIINIFMYSVHCSTILVVQTPYPEHKIINIFMYSVYTALQYLLYRLSSCTLDYKYFHVQCSLLYNTCCTDPLSCTWDYKYIHVQCLHCSTVLVVQTLILYMRL